MNPLGESTERPVVRCECLYGGPRDMILHLTHCTVNLDRLRLVREDGIEEALGALDADVLRFLAERAGEVVTYDDLLTQVWEFRAEHPRGVVQTQMSRLRTLIGDDPKQPVHLFTLRGAGYRLQLPVLPESTAAVRRAIAVVHGVRTLPTGGAVVARGNTVAVVAFEELQSALDWLSNVTAAPGVAAGLHVGEVVRAAGSATLGGAAVHVTRLIARAARPGLVLASRGAREALPTPERGAWRPLGAWRLPELGQVEALWRWVPDGQDAPSVEPAAEPALVQTVPRSETSFFGRRGELTELVARLDAGERLITLLGLGGFGKTRLAVEAARRCRATAVFADLTAATSLSDLIATTAAAMQLRLDSGTGEDAGIQGVARSLQDATTALVVLDNVEQVIEPTRRVLTAWLDAVPHAQFLVTSRVPVAIAAESVVSMVSLPTADGVALLRDRARAVAPSFDGDPDLLAGIVDRLDGIPLAIELLAGRARVLSADQMHARLAQRFALLRSRHRGRQSDMMEILAWSWELLDGETQEILTGLSVFRGGFSAESAAAVLGHWGADLLDSLDTLRELSWIRGGAGRLSLLETVRAFAAAHLGLSRRTELEALHAEWIVTAAEAWIAELPGSGLAPLLAERANLSVARERMSPLTPDLSARALLCEVALVRQHGGPLAPLAGAADELASRLQPGTLRDRLLVARAAIASTLADLPGVERALGGVRPETEPYIVAEAEMVRGYAAYALKPGLPASRVDVAAGHWAAAHTAFTAAGDRAGVTHAAYRVAYCELLRGHYHEALPRLQALLADRSISPLRSAEAWIAVGRCYGRLGRIDEALGAFETAAALPEETSGHLAAEAAEGIAWVHAQRQRWDQAIAAYERVLALHRRFDDRLGEATCLNDLADVARHMGDLDRAEAGYLESLRRVQALGTRDHVVRLNLALVHLLRGRHIEARERLTGLIDEGVPSNWRAAAHVLCLPAAAGTDEAWGEHYAAASALLGSTGFVHEDLALVCEMAARRAAELGERERAQQAWMLAAAQWEAMDETEAGHRARHMAAG